MDPSVSNLDLEQLTDSDKAQLRQFVTNENQRSRVKEQTHVLTDICWKKCVTSSVKSGALDKGEQSCLANCVDRFLDANFMTLKHLGSLRQG